MVARNEIYWADLGPPAGRRPVCVLTRDAAIPVLHSVTCAPVTRVIRSINTEVLVGGDEGLGGESAISCDNVFTVRISNLDPEPIGSLDVSKRAELDRALRYALDILY